MAGDEAAKGVQTRRHMDLNQPRVWLDTSALMPNSTAATPEAPRTGEPEESLAPTAVAYSPSNALSVPEHPMLDPIVYSWLDDTSAAGEEYTDVPELSVPAPLDGPNASGPQLLVAATGLEGDDLLVARSVRPSRVAAAVGGMDMVNTSTLGWSTQGAAAAAALEVGAPELRFLRAIQIHQQHNIVRPGSSNHNQETASADADILALAIQQTRSSYEAARGQNPDGGDNSSFECNICLELARRPVVTSCGHLFCWPCLYQWLHAQSDYSECPVCKGEVLKTDITPIYGRGGGEEPDLPPPRPQAHRRESLRRQLQMAPNTREMARVMRQLIRYQSQEWDARGLPTPTGVETTLVPAARQRAGARRQQRQDNSAPRSTHSVDVGNVASEGRNQNQLLHSDGNIAAQVVLAAPQQPLPVEQLSTSSTAAAIVSEPGSSRQSRRLSEFPAIRRTRRRPQ